VQFLGGFGEVRRLSHGQKVAQMPEFDHREIHRWHLLNTSKQTISSIIKLRHSCRIAVTHGAPAANHKYENNK
jgi:hypothetical protein